MLLQQTGLPDIQERKLREYMVKAVFSTLGLHSGPNC